MDIVKSKIKLFCFPFAGGSRYSYRFLDLLDRRLFEVISLDYPGRGSKLNLPLLTSFESLVNHFIEEFEGRGNLGKFFFFGHSMGAMVAWLLAVKMARLNYPLPAHLVISGSSAPSTYGVSKGRHLLTAKELKNELKELNGCPQEVLENDELFDFFFPIIRADFEATESFRYEANGELAIPFSVLRGTDEPMTDDEFFDWKLETNLPIEFKSFPGDHFYIYEQFANVNKVLTEIAKKIISHY